MTLRTIVFRALNHAAENDEVEPDERIEEVAVFLCDTEAELAGVNPEKLYDDIERWQERHAA